MKKELKELCEYYTESPHAGQELYHKILSLLGVSNSNEIEVGSLIKRIKMPTGNGSQLDKYTLGKTYKVEKIRNNYRFMNKAVGLRSDDNVLRWLSYDRVVKEHELT